jgi:hypothetical protein
MYADDENVAYVTLLLPYQFVHYFNWVQLVTSLFVCSEIAKLCLCVLT